jgi:hypothetical protein
MILLAIHNPLPVVVLLAIPHLAGAQTTVHFRSKKREGVGQSESRQANDHESMTDRA